MSAATEHNPPAFPRDERYLGHNGMTLRDWFAGQALNETISQVMDADTTDDIPKRVAILVYQIADAMLAERGEQS